ncbi:unnamed protein product [Paramecium octaurelia]|uniref:Uncharacterized protein n=1 Tax=Paramecium octaurelia TaxID=43137 RepID=A0A8S1UAG4_PAROT|nr:unnamed protein product [Paramecium octaurelia]
MNINQLEIQYFGNVCSSDQKEYPINSIPQDYDVRQFSKLKKFNVLFYIYLAKKDSIYFYFEFNIRNTHIYTYLPQNLQYYKKSKTQLIKQFQYKFFFQLKDFINTRQIKMQKIERVHKFQIRKKKQINSIVRKISHKNQINRYQCFLKIIKKSLQYEDKQSQLIN